MNPDQSFDELEKALGRVGASITFPATPSMARHVRERLYAERTRGLFVRVAIASAIVLVLALLIIPESRTAIGTFFGAGSSPTTTYWTPTLLTTAQPGINLSPTTAMPPRTGTPSGWCSTCGGNAVDIRLLAKPVAQPIDTLQSK